MQTLLRTLRTRHWHLGLGAILLVLTIAVAALAYWYFTVPTRFTVAVGPRGRWRPGWSAPSPKLSQTADEMCACAWSSSTMCGRAGRLCGTARSIWPSCAPTCSCPPMA